MKSIGTTVGMIMFIGSGLLMFGFWLVAMSSWLGLLGTILAFILVPGLVIFPLIFWIIEGVFPVFYFIVWGIGLIGMVIAGISSEG